MINSSLENSINETCQIFCKEYDYDDCAEIEKGMNSLTFKANDKKTRNLICFKIIPETEFNKNKEEWNILKLLRKFYFY
jgi:hypothetical protein